MPDTITLIFAAILLAAGAYLGQQAIQAAADRSFYLKPRFVAPALVVVAVIVGYLITQGAGGLIWILLGLAVGAAIGASLRFGGRRRR